MVIYTAGARVAHLATAAAPALVLATGLLIFVPWRLTRLITFLDPWADPQKSGFQVVQSLIAVGSGGPNGLGFAQGRQKMLFLPFAHSDFIFCGHWRGAGFIRNDACCWCLHCFFGAVCRIVARAHRFGNCWRWNRDQHCGAGAFQYHVVLSLVPTKGIPLPFISYGGSSLVPTLAAVGILLNISQHATGSLDWELLKGAAEKRTKETGRLRVAPARRMASSRFG